ncbi:MAG: hypothetical protein JO170_26490 [Verrucomicrobia bacterium]|nr:hypothetical protein [Verrucomicrobiota bacterium]
MKNPLSIIFSGVLFTFVVAGALTLSTLKMLESKSAISKAAAPPKEVVSTSSKAPPTIARTDHPVPIDPKPELMASSKPEAPNPTSTPSPEASAVTQNVSRHEAESPSELTRERAEQTREKAERLRARVEGLYQARRISEAAYKQGQAEYQHELAKYEAQIAKLRGATSGTGATNE